MKLVGKSVVPGVAVGRLHIYNNSCTIPKETIIPMGQEQDHLDRYYLVKSQALNELENIIKKLGNDPKADIFKAQKEIVDDIIINEEVPAKIKNDRLAGDWVIYHVYETVLNVLRKTQDPLISERAADFDDVRCLLLRLWYADSYNPSLDNKGHNGCLKELQAPVIIASRELMPSDVANFDKNFVKAIITEAGGLTTHAAILAKSYGIPAVFGLTGLMGLVKQGQMAAVDADTGTVILDPDKDEIAVYEKKASDFKESMKEEKTFLFKEGRTACGVRIDIGLNIANDNTDLEAESYADSVGVFRTEFLYMGRNTLPSEDEQYKVYCNVLECFKDKPVIIRTLDIGGDKQLSYMNLPKEDNPFLGVRALRFCFEHPEIFKTQLRAALRASSKGNLWLMFPMAASIEDIRKAKEYVKNAHDELLKEGHIVSSYKTGIMIEIPSIALIADLAAKEADFASIGSNDLCQYLCAADRMNVNTEEYYQNYHPGMLKIIKETITAFNSAGKPISICGELGADPLAVPLLIGLGLRKFSMNASSLAPIKRVIAGCTIKKCEELADRALQSPTSEVIKAMLSNNFLKG